MKKILSVLMVTVLCLGMVGCSGVQQIDSSQLKTSKSSLEGFSKQIEESLNEQCAEGISVQILTNNNDVTVYYKNSEDVIELGEFRQAVIDNDSNVCESITSNFNKILQKYHDGGFNDIQLINIYVDSRDVILMRLIGSEEIDSDVVRHDFDGSEDIIDDDSSDSSSASNENVYENPELQKGYDEGLINTLKIQTESIYVYLGQPQITVDHDSLIVRMTFDNAPTELLTLMEQGRWTDDDFVSAYSYLNDSVREIFGEEYDTVLTVICGGQLVYRT